MAANSGKSGLDVSGYITQYSRIATRLRNSLWSFVRAGLLLGMGFVIIYPLLIKISTSFMHEQDLFDITVNWIPRELTLSNYYNAIVGLNYQTALMNTFLLAFSVSIVQLISSAIIGYGFARFEFRGSNILFALVILTLIIPPQLIMAPLYLNFRYFDFFGLLGGEGINLIGTYWPFLLTSMTGTGLRNGLFIYIMRQYFKGMPTALEEAAYVDGAGAFQTFYRVMIPGATSALLIVFLFSFVWHWNDLFYMNLFMRGGELLSFRLERMARDYSFYHLDKHGEYISHHYVSILNNTGMLLTIAPLLLVYACLQRYFIESVERTGIIG